jgi:squalene-hopene/tetraprenyl-beta-curcumene cyclase
MHPVPVRGLDQAIAAATDHLLVQQRETGGWRAPSIAGPDATAEAAIALRLLGLLTPADADRIAAFLLKYQLPDGSFPAYEGTRTGTLEQTCICYAALLSVGLDPASECAESAFRFIQSKGAFLSAGPYTQILLAVAGVLPPGFLPRMPVVQLLIPGFARILGRRFTPAFTIMSILLPTIVNALRARVERPSWLSRLLFSWARRKVIRYLMTHQNPSGNLFGGLNLTVMLLIAYHLLEVPRAHESFSRLISDLARWRTDDTGTTSFSSLDANVWNSALTLGTLRRGGIAVDHAAIISATQFLLREQSLIPLPRDWQAPGFTSPRVGGWAFEEGNPLGADCDSTSVVLWGLGHLPRSGEVKRAIEKALEWLWGMQNRDGGWPSFSHGKPSKPAGPFSIESENPDLSFFASLRLLLNVPPQFGDPSLEDVTGRVLQALGHLGFRAADPRVARAVDFLLSQVDCNGAWWGRWETNYLAATSEVLAGLAVVGANLHHPVVRNAIAWVKAHQHSSGGFGESEQSYANLALAGKGEPSAYLTGIVASALIACGEARSETVARAIAWCVTEQRPDGSWVQGSYQFTMQWPWPFYQLELTPVIYPLRSLIEYRQACAQ